MDVIQAFELFAQPMDIDIILTQCKRHGLANLQRERLQFVTPCFTSVQEECCAIIALFKAIVFVNVTFH